MQKEVGSCCPFCENSDVEHFEVHHIDENNSNNERSNLLLLCPICHSKITKGDLTMEDVARRKKELASVSHPTTKSPNVIQFNGKIRNAVIGNNNVVTITSTRQKKIRQKYPEGCIGSDNLRANYIGYLIGRYNEYKEWEVGKEKMKYAAFPALLKRQLKLAPSRTIYNAPIDRFEWLVAYVQKRIDETRLAKINKSKGKFKNYSSWEDYQKTQGAGGES